METISLKEIQETNPKGFFKLENNQVFLNLEDTSKKVLICSCGKDKFVKEGILLRCLSCDNLDTLILR